MRRILNRIKKDDGNSIILLGIMLLVAGLLIGGMMLDISKAYQLKASYTDAAKKATQAAIRYQNTEGGLLPEAAAEAVRVYEYISKPEVVKGGYFNKCKEVDDVEITITFKDEQFQTDNVVFRINRSQITENDVEKIYRNMRKSSLPNNNHTGLEIKVTESTPNVILPTAFRVTKGDETGVMCQELDIKAGASSFFGETGKYE